MSAVRERFAAVIKQSFAMQSIVTRSTYPEWAITCDYLSQREFDQVLDALCAALPVVTRAAIVDIFNKHQQVYNLLKDWQVAIADAIVRLVGGEATQTWCEHLLWGTFFSTDDTPRWYYVNSHGIKSIAGDDWRICPVCATPRPE